MLWNILKETWKFIMKYRISRIKSNIKNIINGEYYKNHLWQKKGNIYDNNKPKYFIVRRRDANCGLFSYFITMLGGIKYAVDHGYLPVVDMKNYPNTYLNKKYGGGGGGKFMGILFFSAIW
jgi:hypothetical protein